ncbi:MAG: hypothetical protein SFY95_09465 [Planctomycetota bacterium]|nr:hypothetical protein [Planctomycetota bacterium]
MSKAKDLLGRTGGAGLVGGGLKPSPIAPAANTAAPDTGKTAVHQHGTQGAGSVSHGSSGASKSTLSNVRPKV